MSRNLGPFPDGIDESDLLALVEGEALAPGKATLLNAALAKDPTLAALVTGMRRDRVTLRSMPEPACPPGVVESVASLLERRMLTGQSSEAEFPRFEPKLAGGKARGRRTRWGDGVAKRTLAVAAMLVIAGGLSYYFTTTQTTPQAPTPESGKSFARNTDKALPQPAMAMGNSAKVEAKPAVPAQPPINETGGGGGPRGRAEVKLAVVDKQESPEEPVATFADRGVSKPEASRDASSMTKEVETATTLARADGEAHPAAPLAAEAGATGAIVDAARAIELASERRLVVCVRGCDVPSGDASGRGGWYVGDQVDREFVEAMAPIAARFANEHAPSDPRERLSRILAMSPAPGMMQPMMLESPIASAPDSGPQLSTAALRLDTQAIDALVGAVRERGGEVVLKELPESHPIDTPPVIPASVNWFGQPGIVWQRWEWVPVVVEY